MKIQTMNLDKGAVEKLATRTMRETGCHVSKISVPC